jgi:hypothetical protein
MIWRKELATVFLVTATAGFVIGLFLRVPAIILATAVVILAGIAVSLFRTEPWSAASFQILCLVVILQVAYLAGVAAVTLARRLCNH